MSCVIGHLPLNLALEQHFQERVSSNVLAKGVRYLRPLRQAVNQTLSTNREIFLESLLGEMWMSIALNELQGREESEVNFIRKVFTQVIYSHAIHDNLPMNEWTLLPESPTPILGLVPGQEYLRVYDRQLETKEERLIRRQRNLVAQRRQEQWESYGFVYLPDACRFSPLREFIFNRKRDGREFSETESMDSDESEEEGPEIRSDEEPLKEEEDGQIWFEDEIWFDAQED
ncbi:hypothetical protein BDZ89DRAFT_1036889 [Hymenopellis radicata]|nr:hypothetical protein BDZ89DRAFT_1036889 [Hymenopellis radicata]